MNTTVNTPTSPATPADSSKSEPKPYPDPVPDVIYIIRHGEKPMPKWPKDKATGKPCTLCDFPDTTPVTYGVDCKGNQGELDDTSAPSNTSLTPRGWQRAGALAVLFAETLDGAGRFRQPKTIIATEYVPKSSQHESTTTDTDSHRPYETVQALSERIAVTTQSPCALGDEKHAMEFALGQQGVVLICWEHHHIYNRAAKSGLVAELVPIVDNPDDIFDVWNDCCFDAVWAFTKTSVGSYHFEQLSQSALAGDAVLPTGKTAGVPT